MCGENIFGSAFLPLIFYLAFLFRNVNFRLTNVLLFAKRSMKVTFNIECTPEEARVFLGLPNIAPMQEALMTELEDRLRANIQAMSPDCMMKTWLPTSLQNVEQAQKAFWSQVQQTLNGLTSTTTNAMLSFAEQGKR